MGKLAFLYPGQGSQRVGMGADLSELRPELYSSYLDEADRVSGLPIRDYSLVGPADSLMQTQVAQPALFALSLALTEVARELGLRPDFVAGHSLGEYTAAAASGAISTERGLALVCQRGSLMAEIQSQRPGAMGAVIGLSAKAVGELCAQAADQGVVVLANLNTPAQIVVSGEEPAVAKVVELAREAGADKALRLQVGAAFHSELMKPVQARLGETMRTLTWHDPSPPLVANFSAQLVTTGEAVHEALVAQIASPVRWVECVQTLLDAGCTTFLELGSGRVLTGLVRQIAQEADAFAADSPKKLATFVDGRPLLVGAGEEVQGGERTNGGSSGA